jgi:hypothetical protein
MPGVDLPNSTMELHDADDVAIVCSKMAAPLGNELIQFSLSPCAKCGFLATLCHNWPLALPILIGYCPTAVPSDK